MPRVRIADRDASADRSGLEAEASVHIVRGEAAVGAHDPGGLDVLSADLPASAERLLAENHTLKRA